MMLLNTQVATQVIKFISRTAYIEATPTIRACEEKLYRQARVYYT